MSEINSIFNVKNIFCELSFWYESSCLWFQYLSCLSTSSSNDKLAFDVGLKEKAQGESEFFTARPNWLFTNWRLLWYEVLQLSL